MSMDVITVIWKKNQGGEAQAAADQASPREAGRALTVIPPTVMTGLQGLSAGTRQMEIAGDLMIVPARHQATGPAGIQAPVLTAVMGRAEMAHVKLPAGREVPAKDQAATRGEGTAGMKEGAARPGVHQEAGLLTGPAINSDRFT